MSTLQVYRRHTVVPLGRSPAGGGRAWLHNKGLADKGALPGREICNASAAAAHQAAPQLPPQVERGGRRSGDSGVVSTAALRRPEKWGEVSTVNIINLNLLKEPHKKLKDHSTVSLI